MKLLRQGGFLLSRIHRESKRCFARLLRRHGIELTPIQGRVLFPLWREGALPIHEIGRRTGLGKSTLTGLVDRLERDGHARRLRSAEDRRVVVVEPTARDRGGQAALTQVSAEMTSIFYAGFSDAEIDRFERDLARVLDNLVAERARPRRATASPPPAARRARKPGRA